jgi:hypothetical protein
MTVEERKEQLNKLEHQAKALQKAIQAGNPSFVKGIYSDEEIKWMCDKCPYLEKCTDLRKNDDAITEGAVAA